jgi:hypothetical protein
MGDERPALGKHFHLADRYDFPMLLLLSPVLRGMVCL